MAVNQKQFLTPFFTVVIVVLVTLVKLSKCGITVTPNGIHGVSIALSSDLKEENCETYVALVKDVFHEASKSLLESLEGLRFSSALIITPESWTSCGSYTIETAGGPLTWESSNVRVGHDHPLFGSEPWTQQPRGCGLPGNFIYISTSWLENKIQRKGPRLVHEWAKFRWGLFEEYGHFEDDIYPKSFVTSNQERNPNICTNKPLNINYKECEGSSDCDFTLQSSDIHVSSSLMAVPELLGVDSFCIESNHKSGIPTKQNTFCEGKSSREIIQRHNDMQKWSSFNTKEKPSNLSPLNIKVVRETKLPSVLMAYETTDDMRQFGNQYEFLVEAIAQFIYFEAPTSALFGLVSFNQESEVQYPLIELDKDSRKFLAQKVLKSTTSGTTVNLKEAIKTSAKILGTGNGVILLITRGTSDNDPVFTAQELAMAADGHPVWTVLYPKSSDKFVSIFDDLASLTGGQLLSVDQVLDSDSNGNNIMSPTVRMGFSETLRQTLHLDPTYDMQQINSGECFEDPCEILLPMRNNFKGKSYLYLYTGTSDEISSVEINLPDCYPENLISYWPAVQTTFVDRCLLRGTSKTAVLTVKRKVAYGKLVVEFVGHPNYNDSNFQFKIFASTHMYDLRYSSSSAPVIFAQLTYLQRTMFYADISMTYFIENRQYHLKLNDEGIGADVTGNDGIYSAYLVPVIPVGNFSFNISASNSFGKAKLMPLIFKDGSSITCCGSLLNLPTDLDSSPLFSNLTRVFVQGRISEMEDYLKLPPGQIRDLKATQEEEEIQVKFTAPGGDFTYGKVISYLVTFHNESGYFDQIKLKQPPSDSGELEVFKIEKFQCESFNSLSVVAVDDQDLCGPNSNIANIYVTCSATKITTGAAIGIAFGVLLLLIVTFLIILLYVSKKNKKERVKDQELASRNHNGTFICTTPPPMPVKEDDDNTIVMETPLVTGQPIFLSDNFSPNFILSHSTPNLLEGEPFVGHSKDSFAYSSVEYPEQDTTWSIQSNVPRKRELRPQDSINQVGIPILDQNLHHHRNFRSMDDLPQNNQPKKPPRVPPKPFLKNIQV